MGSSPGLPCRVQVRVCKIVVPLDVSGVCTAERRRDRAGCLVHSGEVAHGALVHSLGHLGVLGPRQVAEGEAGMIHVVLDSSGGDQCV